MEVKKKVVISTIFQDIKHFIEKKKVFVKTLATIRLSFFCCEYIQINNICNSNQAITIQQCLHLIPENEINVLDFIDELIKKINCIEIDEEG